MENKKWLLIENKGEIDPNALILMGGSTKRDSETAIGFYGSGNKYAIALMIRNNIPFKMFTGKDEVKITTEDISFRDKSFSRILINGQQTSLTTDMGPQWDNWMAIREWVSNAIDEGGNNIINDASEIRPKEGYTRIYIEHHEEVLKVIKRWDRYFAFDRTDAIVECAEGRIYPQNDADERTLIYRRGIQCYEPKSDSSLYCYDIPDVKINESRVVEDDYNAKCKIVALLLSKATKEIAARVMYNSTESSYVESRMDWVYACYGTSMNDQWRAAIGDRIIISHEASGFYTNLMGQPHYIVPKSMAQKIKKSFSDVQVYGVGADGDENIYKKVEEVTPKMQFQIKKAKEALSEMKYKVSHEIEIVEFNKTDTLGRAADGKILLSNKLFDMGIRQIVLIIMEEEEHLITKYKDETRAFQDHLFNKWLSAMEEQYGIFL